MAKMWVPLPNGRVEEARNCDDLVITDNKIAIWQDNTAFYALLPPHIRLSVLTNVMAPPALSAPDGEGWWAFEGSEWESKPIYLKDGVEYDEWQEEWNERAERYWDRYELPWIEPVRYDDVPGEPFRAVVEVKWATRGMSVCQHKQSGPYEGDPVLAFLSPKYRWNYALYTVDTWVGKWTRVNLPWDVQAKEERCNWD